MPNLNPPPDDRGTSSTRRLSLPRRSTPESTQSPVAVTAESASSPTEPSHASLDSAVSPTTVNARASPVPPGLDPNKIVDHISFHSQEPPSAASLRGPRSLPTADAGRKQDDVVGAANGMDEAAGSANEAVNSAAGLNESQNQLNQYRARLAKDLERREMASRGIAPSPLDKARVSPIQEESVGTPSVPASLPTTASTESGNTIRGGYTPGLSLAGTPSYPFPRMTNTPGYAQRPFPSLSPSASSFMSRTMSPGSYSAQDKVLSDSSTPGSAMTFHPSGYSAFPPGGDYPTPNLYDLSLMLNAEPGVDAWWVTVVQIMRDVYKAERVTLSIPADSTDIENVPWGQKATYNEHEEDELSVGYLARGSSMVPSSTEEVTDDFPAQDDHQRFQSPRRPSLQNRHSFTSFEENKEQKGLNDKVSALRRPTQLSRSKSHFSPGRTPHDNISGYNPALKQTTLAEHDAQDEHVPVWDVPQAPDAKEKGRVLPVLQALDYEADPLIDHGGVTRVLERGKVIALTRSYPYLQNQSSDAPVKSNSTTKAADEPTKKRPKKSRVDSSTKLSTLLGNVNPPRNPLRDANAQGTDNNSTAGKMSRLDEEDPQPKTPQYEEFEQAPPSPWSQSPAPSPAVRPDPKENPFFTDATVDEGSFNPSSAPADYSSIAPPEAIGIDNSWTVLHIPLTHLLLSKPVHPFKLDATAMEQKSHAKGRGDGQGAPAGNRSPHLTHRKPQSSPIAILSILSPIIPYPSNLRHSLEHLGPHLATSFSMCRHYSNLETELAGLQRRRPQTAGFGAIATDGRPLADPTETADFGSVPPESLIQQSGAGSITSPSDYSGVSKSAAGSPGGTPSWEAGSLSMIMDRRQGTSPAQISSSGDGYFSSKQKPMLSKAEAPPSSSGSQRTRKSSKETSPVDKRTSRLSGGTRAAGAPAWEDESWTEKITDEVAPSSNVPRRHSSNDPKDLQEDLSSGEARAKHVDSRASDDAVHHRHTLLHSYGADFATSFQSLPPSSSVVSRSTPYPGTSCPGSLHLGPADMPPPSDRLKGLMLDALPAHVFVALPQTGEIVWVNSRFLTYRGQTVADLAADPWGCIHAEDREDYLKAWGHSLRTGEQFSRTVRIRRFDGAYRWFYARAVASRDKRGVLMQFLGSYMDIHDQHIAELKAARQEEIEVSEAKHRLLANLIPQIIFTATEDEGITFANDQWLSYTGQSFEDCQGLGFMDFVHPEDLAKCKIPTDKPPSPLGPRSPEKQSNHEAQRKGQSPEPSLRGIHQALSRNNSSSSSSVYGMPTADLSELARKGIIKVTFDSSGRRSYTTEVRLRSKNGEYRWHLIRCVEIDSVDFGNGVISFFGSATDINDHKLLEAKLKEAMESKGRFLSNMSHEIRTPLIGISGMVSFLQDTVLNEEQRDYTNTIQTSANSLLMIINDILDLSKVDAGMMKLKHEWFHTRALIEDVNELVSTMAIAKHLELNYVVDEDVPTWVKGDKVRIRQVLLNVIGNAIKFTSNGEVFSRCRIFRPGSTSPVGSHEIMLEFSIVDTGRGFTKEEADLIFKPFSQIDGSSTRQHGGSGLGLVISRQLVELHGGKMQGTAVPGKGSTFTFTARFALPTEEDHPDVPLSPQPAPSGNETRENVVLPPPGFKPLPPPVPARLTPQTSPGVDAGGASLASSGSSDPSVNSAQTQATERSSVSSVNVGLVRFSEAARASGQDLSQMKLEMPSSETSQGSTPTHNTSKTLDQPDDLRPLIYSILIISPQTHSREATVQHIEQTLPKELPHQVTALESVDKADELIGGDDPVHFTHIVLNLASPEEIMAMMHKMEELVKADKTTVLILSDTGQRQAVMNMAAEAGHKHDLFSEDLVTFINKPVKPSRFAVIFDPEKVRDSSIDRNRSTAQRMVETQKQSYEQIEKRMGNKGYKVLLVEDNLLNQKVLQKYLKKVGVEVEVAADGVECIDMVFSRGHEYYSLILCDLHMPRKDGYQACREIRSWEGEQNLRTLPIIALSANVMSDVQDKCLSAGFSDYVTKPVDFIDLSRAMSKFF